MTIHNTINAGPAFANQSESVKALARELCTRYVAASVLPDGDGGLIENVNPESIHADMCRDAHITYFDANTGGWVWVSYTTHVDAPTGAILLCVGGVDGCGVYELRDGDDGANPQDSYSDDEGNADDEGRAIMTAEAYDNGTGDAYVIAAAGQLHEAARLLDAELRRIFGTGLEDEQRDALRDGSDCFGMLDDMEARMGCDVADARSAAIFAHCLLDMAEEIANAGAVGAVGAARVHELGLSLEYAEWMRNAGMATYYSADEMAHHPDLAIYREDGNWCARFVARWDQFIDAPYIAGNVDDLDAHEVGAQLKLQPWAVARLAAMRDDA